MQKSQQIRAAVRSLLLLQSAAFMSELHAAEHSFAQALSYSAGGTCYCTSETVQSMPSGKVYPTPIGGQTIAQICQRVGTGPGLLAELGAYNHPAYGDAQCGNGPFVSNAVEPLCAGLVGPGKEMCLGTGPEWDLKAAYSNPATTTENNTAVSAAGNTVLSTSESAVAIHEGQAVQIQKPQNTAELKLATIVREVKINSDVNPQSVAEKIVAEKITPVIQDPSAITAPLNPMSARDIAALPLAETQPDMGTAVVLGSTPKSTWVEREITATSRPNAFASEQPVITRKTYFTETVVEEPQLAEPQLAAALTTSNPAAASPNTPLVIELATQPQSMEQFLPGHTFDETIFPITSESISVDNLGHGELSEKDIAMLPTANTAPADNDTEFLNAAAAEAEMHKPAVKIINVDGSVSIYSRDQIARLGGSLEPYLGAATEALPAEGETAPKEPDIDKKLDIHTEANGIESDALQSATASATANATASIGATLPPTTTAIKAPRTIFAGKLNYQYVDATPVSYDFGGNGLEMEVSGSSHNRMAYFGRVAVSDEYYEGLLGLGFYFSPYEQGNTDFILNLGVEYGNFDLGITELDSTGGYIAAYVRSKPFRRFELQGGASYSSFFEGDANAFAAGIVQLTPKLNAISKVEVGDNDNVSLGFRFYY